MLEDKLKKRNFVWMGYGVGDARWYLAVINDDKDYNEAKAIRRITTIRPHTACCSSFMCVVRVCSLVLGPLCFPACPATTPTGVH